MCHVTIWLVTGAVVAGVIPSSITIWPFVYSPVRISRRHASICLSTTVDVSPVSSSALSSVSVV